MGDWKSEAIRLRFDEGLTWTQLVERLQGEFPGKTSYQMRNRIRDVVRRSGRYRSTQAIAEPEPPNPEIEDPTPAYKTTTGWKNGVFESDDLIRMCKEDAKSPRRMLELHGLDPDDWEVVSCTNNLWHGQVHHSQVDERGQRVLLYQSKLTAKPLRNQITFKDVERAFANADFWASKPKVLASQYDPNGETLEIDTADVHAGLMAWARETGAAYDLAIARDCLMHVISDNINRCEGRKLKKIILADLGDLIHIDTAKLTTTNGTQQEADGPLQRIGEFAVYMVVDALMMLGEIAPVEFVPVNGNHDTITGYMLALAIKAAFRNDPNISVDTEPNPQKWRLIGDSLVGFVHGDMPEANLSGWLQVVARGMDKPIRFMEVHSGHRHAQKVKERVQTSDNEGVVIRTMPAITNASPWAHRSGYVARRAAASFVWSETDGLREMWYCNM